MEQRVDRGRGLLMAVLMTAVMAPIAFALILSFAASSVFDGAASPSSGAAADQRVPHWTDAFIDTNADGRVDVHEYYEDGALWRRESDRDFNNRIDFIEEFDLESRQRTRTVTDVDNDGRADLLQLYQNGRVVYVKWATATAPRARQVSTGSAAGAGLRPLDDPFATDLAVRPTHRPGSSPDFVGLSTSGGMPERRFAVRPLAPAARVVAPEVVRSLSPLDGSSTSRGPPASAHHI